jgi:selenocysteine-specific elongation factor
VLDSLYAEGAVTRRGGGYAPARDAPGPPDPIARRLVELLAADGLEPRSVDALAAQAGVSPAEARERLDRLAASGDVTRVKAGLYYHPAGLERARAEVVSLCERDGSATIASLRDRLATSRKYAQAVLEHLDGARVTRRVGDEHILRK